jgi:hypothetical protein
MKLRGLRWITFLCLICVACGCVHKKKKSMEASAPFASPIVIGYEANGAPAYAVPQSPPAPDQNQLLAWQANLSVEVLNLSNAVAHAVALAEKAGGYLESRSDETYYDPTLKRRTYSGASLRLRIPTQAFTNVVGAVETLGTVTGRHVETEDVTAQYVDTDARLKNKQVLRDRLRGLLEKATEVKDVLAIETELNRVQSDIDAMEALIKGLKGRVDFATLDLNFQLKKVAPKKILGPLGLLFKGIFWTIEKLFVIRE